MTTQTETNKLFIGNLSRKIRRPDLKEYFSQRGEVAYASVAMDRETNRSRGFGFVTFVNEEDAQNALEEANEKELEGRPMYISFAESKEESSNESDQEEL